MLSEFEADGGRLLIERSSDLFLSRVTGRFGRTLVDRFVAELDAAVAARRAPLIAFHDWVEMTDYEVAGRIRLTQWTLRHRHHVSAVHFLLGSQLVAFGVGVANVALGGFMKVHTDRTAFEAALRDARGA
jgi:hypothetical protein